VTARLWFHALLVLALVVRKLVYSWAPRALLDTGHIQHMGVTWSRGTSSADHSRQKCAPHLSGPAGFHHVRCDDVRHIMSFRSSCGVTPPIMSMACTGGEGEEQRNCSKTQLNASKNQCDMTDRGCEHNSSFNEERLVGWPHTHPLLRDVRDGRHSLIFLP
jgi:hypothetical protein